MDRSCYAYMVPKRKYEQPALCPDLRFSVCIYPYESFTTLDATHIDVFYFMLCLAHHNYGVT